MTNEAQGRGLTRFEAWSLALTATLTMTVSYVDRQTLSVVAPTVCKTLGLSDAQYGLLGSGFALAYLVGAPLAGRFIDAVGARRGLFGAVLVWSLVAALHALAPGFGALFALRIALGLAESPSFPGASQTVHRALPPEERSRGLGILFTGSSIGSMIAPPLATYLTTRFDVRAAFLGTALVGLAWVPLWMRVAWSRRGRAALDRKHEMIVRDVAPEAKATPYRAERRVEARQPLRGLAVAKHPAVLRATLVVLASAPFINLLFTWGAKYLVADHHLVQAEVGRYLWFPPLFFDAGAIAFGHYASRARERGYLGPPRFLLGAAMVLGTLGVLVPLGGDPRTAMLIAAVALTGGGGMYALAAADMLPRVPPEAVATAGGICAAAQSVAQIAANALIGLAVQRLGYAWMMVALALWTVPGCLGWILWTPPPVWTED